MVVSIKKTGKSGVPLILMLLSLLGVGADKCVYYCNWYLEI